MKKINLVLVGIVIISIFFGYKILNRGLHITLINNTENDINEIYFTYEGIPEFIEAPEIEANSKKEIRINPKEDFNENVLSMYYLDRSGNRKFTEVAYFEKGYNTVVTITFEPINDSSDFEIKVNIELDY